MSKLKILIVDDEEDIRYVIKRYLETANANFMVFEACDGREAIRKLQNDVFQAMIIDINLPFKNGFEVLKAIGEDKLIVKPKTILFMTGALDDNSFNLLEQKINYPILRKPFDFSEVLKHLTLDRPNMSARASKSGHRF